MEKYAGDAGGSTGFTSGGAAMVSREAAGGFPESAGDEKNKIKIGLKIILKNV
jgi:hypothetical protein